MSFTAMIRFMALAVALFATPGTAQQATIAFGDLQQNTTLPVEIAAETFSVNNADGTALFSGEVQVKQGDMTLAAAEVLVEYDLTGKAINRLLASGGVTITSLGDAAAAKEAVYTIESGQIVLTGDVLLTQGPSAMSGQKLTLNLTDGTGVMEGRVTTTFVPGAN